MTLVGATMPAFDVLDLIRVVGKQFASIISA
jgi:hypothetical protein